MRILIFFLFALAIGKVSAQTYIRQQSADQTIISAYRAHALAACQKTGQQQTSQLAGQRTPNVTVELIIGKSDLNVRLWQTGHAQWSARYRDPFILVKSQGGDRPMICEYDINRGTIATRMYPEQTRAAG